MSRSTLRTRSLAVALAATGAVSAGVVALTPSAQAASTAATKQLTVTVTGPVIRQGSTGSAVRAWQQDIDRVAGKFPTVPRVSVDGVFGPATASATRAFQQANDISVDGVVGSHSYAAMTLALQGSPPAATTSGDENAPSDSQPSPSDPVIRQGSTGSSVRAWQNDIDRVEGKFGSAVPHVSVDSVFGPATAAATRDFQRAQHVTADGIVGPDTYRAMDTALHGSQ